jgi:hypothetical protein
MTARRDTPTAVQALHKSDGHSEAKNLKLNPSFDPGLIVTRSAPAIIRLDRAQHHPDASRIADVRFGSKNLSAIHKPPADYPIFVPKADIAAEGSAVGIATVGVA